MHYQADAAMKSLPMVNGKAVSTLDYLVQQPGQKLFFSSAVTYCDRIVSDQELKKAFVSVLWVKLVSAPKAFPARFSFSKLKRVSLHVSQCGCFSGRGILKHFKCLDSRSMFVCGCCVSLVRGHCYGLWQGIHDHSMGQRRDFSASDVVQLRDMHLGGEVRSSSGSKNPNLLCKA